MRREPGNISRTALNWTPEGKQKQGRPKNTWCWNTEGELKTLHHTWGTVQLAQNGLERSTFVAAPARGLYPGGLRAGCIFYR